MRKRAGRCAARLLSGSRRCRSFAETLVLPDGERIQLPTCSAHGSVQFGSGGRIKKASKLGLSKDQLRDLDAAGRKWWHFRNIERERERRARLPWPPGMTYRQFYRIYCRLLGILPKSRSDGLFTEEEIGIHLDLQEALRLALIEELGPDLARVEAAIEETSQLPTSAPGRILRYFPRR